MKKALSLFMSLVMLFTITAGIDISAQASYENTYKNTGNQRIDIVEIAKTQIGNTNGSKYGSGSWCAHFVIWCARQASVSSSVIATTGYACADDMKVPYYSRSSYSPKAGDLVYFDWPSTSQYHWDHVGIVEKVNSDGSIQTIEGNSIINGVSAVRRRVYTANGASEYSRLSSIRGYGVPNYNEYSSHTVDTNYGKNFTAYLNNPSNQIPLYNSNHTVASGHYITGNDPCTIHEVYTDGCCKVSYTTDSGVTRTYYTKYSYFKTHTHSYTNRYYEPEHPHRISERCSCGAWRWTNEYHTINSCEQCWKVTWHTSKSAVNLKVGDSDTVNIYISDVVVPEGAKFKTTYDNTMVDCSSKNVSSGIDYTFTGKKAGKTNFVLTVYSDSTLSKKISSYSIPITVTNKEYLICYDSNGGNPSYFKEYTSEDGTFVFTNKIPTKEGYTFLGWNTTKNATKPASSSIISPGKTLHADKDLYFYAVWRPNNLTVKYNANGGTIISNTYKLYNNLVALKSNNETVLQIWNYNQTQNDGLYNASTFGISRTGHVFKGWGTTKVGGIVFNENDSSILPTNINTSIRNGDCTTTLYAIWEPVEYTVTYDANGGIGAPSSQIKVYGEPLILSNTEPTRDGYEFLGWSDSKSAQEAKYLPSESYAVNSSTTLYAVWEKKHIHSYTSNLTKPTCTEPGLIILSCSCGDVKITNIPENGHSIVIDAAVSATCTKAGLTLGKHCSVCNKVLVAQETINSKGHTFNGGRSCIICGADNPNYVEPTTQAPAPTEPTTQTPTTQAQPTTQPTAQQETTTTTATAEATTAKPKATSIKKLTKGKKSFKATWKKLTGVSGYQVQYSTDKKFKKNTKTVTIKKNTASTTVKKLKANKKYYVRVRSYKNAKVGGKTVKVYSSWSKVKSVTTK